MCLSCCVTTKLRSKGINQRKERSSGYNRKAWHLFLHTRIRTADLLIDSSWFMHSGQDASIVMGVIGLNILWLLNMIIFNNYSFNFNTDTLKTLPLTLTLLVLKWAICETGLIILKSFLSILLEAPQVVFMAHDPQSNRQFQQWSYKVCLVSLLLLFKVAWVRGKQRWLTD